MFKLKINGFFITNRGHLNAKDENSRKFSNGDQAIDYVRENYPIAFSEGSFKIVEVKNG